MQTSSAAKEAKPSAERLGEQPLGVPVGGLDTPAGLGMREEGDNQI